jgi:glycosyltransferase involved in cell wall biosynthesis
MENKSRVVFCGRLNADDLHHVTASALAITYVSYFEGFGIPIVEAFRCGVPVITANITAMPEVAGEAALLIDPFDEKAIANAMQQLVENHDLRKKLIDSGFKRAKLFSWDQAAQKLWQSMMKTISKSNKTKQS